MCASGWFFSPKKIPSATGGQFTESDLICHSLRLLASPLLSPTWLILANSVVLYQYTNHEFLPTSTLRLTLEFLWLLTSIAILGQNEILMGNL